ncbi:enoyl-CoA hydratase [Bacillus sp. FJAT-27225]|uniref:MaoC family dehydratase n=1 Tax=Bacillus sp. FJAT-27225 TaxID=1743144 RepID=UPI00080C341A|nr:MaoC family dehydratase [Bacillus sp. FJAT-27225]OCA87954.1 enoyl-CoA hydratase [Bacillus sp. FJAT-27225]
MAIKIGDKASMAKTVTESDVYLFAGITGDLNPAHVNEQYAQGTPFKTRIAHGMLSGGFISAVLAMKLPGPGTIYLSQEMKFTKPVFIGDTITAEVEAIEFIDKGKFKILELATTCYNQHGDVVLEGRAKVIPPKAE